MRRWYGESVNYDFLTPGWRKDAVHFTQIIWSATTDIGVGVAKMDDPIDNKYVVVVHYYPAGKDEELRLETILFLKGFSACLIAPLTHFPFR